MYKNYQEEALNHLKNIELMILKDFIDICDKNNLNYYLIYGTNIGAVRHEGFIPWDDDIDLIMSRKDYQKFLKIMEENPIDKYEILDVNYQNDYFFMFGRMSLKDTHFDEFWAKQVDFNLGIHIDIFILDNLPKNKFKRFFFRKKCFILDKLLTMSAIKLVDYPKPVMVVSNAMHFILNALNLKPQHFQRKCEKLFRKYENEDTDLVADLTLAGIPVFEKSDFEPPQKVKFESIEANIPNKSDKILKVIYGDYMQIPPEEERVNHALDNLDFGEY